MYCSRFWMRKQRYILSTSNMVPAIDNLSISIYGPFNIFNICNHLEGWYKVINLLKNTCEQNRTHVSGCTARTTTSHWVGGVSTVIGSILSKYILCGRAMLQSLYSLISLLVDLQQSEKSITLSSNCDTFLCKFIDLLSFISQIILCLTGITFWYFWYYELFIPPVGLALKR